MVTYTTDELRELVRRWSLSTGGDGDVEHLTVDWFLGWLEEQQSTINEIMLADVQLLCVECQRPIKARINTQQWIRVEWIGPAGECQGCYNEKKENSPNEQPNNQ